MVKRDEFLDYLKSNRLNVFNIHEAARIFGKPEKYVSMRLSSMPRIKRATRGVYYLQDTDIGEIATGIISPSYISLVSAFALHEATTQIPLEMQVISPVQHKMLEVEGYRIRFIRLSRNRIFGYTRIDSTMVATLEKAIVDSLYLNMYSGEALEVATENVTRLDIDRMIDYGVRMRSSAALNRLGFIIEMMGKNADKLLPLRSGRYVKFGHEGNTRNTKWRVVHAY